MKTKVILFDSNNYARIFINPSEDILSLPNALINPDLHDVHNISPEFWKLENNKIVSMSEDEKLIREQDLEKPKSNIFIKEIEKIIYVPVEKIVNVDKIVEIIKEVPIQITHHIEVPIEKEVIKFVDVIKEIPIEIYKDVIKEIKVIQEIEKVIKVIPKWVWGIISIQTIIIVLLLIK